MASLTHYFLLHGRDFKQILALLNQHKVVARVDAVEDDRGDWQSLPMRERWAVAQVKPDPKNWDSLSKLFERVIEIRVDEDSGDWQLAVSNKGQQARLNMTDGVSEADITLLAQALEIAAEEFARYLKPDYAADFFNAVALPYLELLDQTRIRWPQDAEGPSAVDVNADDE